MRISTGQQFMNLQNQIARAEARMADLQRQLATGRRLNAPSDAPLAAMAALSFRGARSVAGQHLRNAETGRTNMRLAEGVISEMSDAVNRARTLSIQAANAPTTQEGRQAIVGEINRIMERLVELANTRDAGGDYLFAGQEIKTRPFEVAGGALNYNGDAGVQLVEAGPGLTIQKNMVIDGIVGQAYAALEDARNRIDGGDLSGITGVTLQLLEDASSSLRLLRGNAGVAVQKFEEAATTATRRSDDFTALISQKEDADLAEVIVNLQAAQTTYQASLAAFATIHQTGLLQFLRP